MTRVLYLGGTGELSRACVEESLRLGHAVTVFNRGNDNDTLPDAVTRVAGDVRDAAARSALAGQFFDVVCQFLAFTPDAITRDIDTFGERCGQYIFVSSAAAYRKPCRDWPVTEATPLQNPFWEYGRNKAACEALLGAFMADGRIVATIVRPSHTYRTRLPGTILHGDHQAHRMLAGKPVIVHGDGQSLWTLTHANDFARAFCRLCGEPAALAETVHITASEAYAWDHIVRETGAVLGVTPLIRHVASDVLVRYEPAWTGPLLGDKAASMVFDNSRVSEILGGWQAQVSLEDGLSRAGVFVRKRLAAGYTPDPVLDALVDRIIDDHDRLAV